MASIPETTPQPSPSAGDAYRFDTFTLGLLIPDMYFGPDEPGPGEQAPTFDLELLGGGRLRSDALGDRPVLLIFGSRTCPVTESAGPRLVRLHRTLGHAVRFVLVNTREAHPGDLIPQPQTLEEKRAHAEVLRDHHGVPFEVAVDDIDGTVHRAFGPKPNSAYLLSPGGLILYRAHWANDDDALQRAIRGVLTHGRPPHGKSRRTIGPMMRAVGHLPSIIEAGGPRIAQDVWRAAPPLALLARASQLMPWLAVDKRGAWAALLTFPLLIAAIAAVALAF